jgi:sterol desaturase/sphingolipid hydroxylase (fatty acid hydroxylase superfamily)
MFSDWLITHGETVQFGAYFTWLAALAIAELAWPHRPGPMQRGRRWTTNFALTVLNVSALGVLPIGFLGVALWAQREGIGILNVVPLPVPALIGANLLARSFIAFLTHYLMHMVPAFWRVHRVHHLDTELDISTTVRFHPLEFVVGLALGVPIVVALGLTPWMLVAYEIGDGVVNLWTHSNTRLPGSIDRAIRRVITTPSLHRIHHSAWKPETNSNYGAVFPLWDIVFGTYRTETREPSERMLLGLEDTRGAAAQQLGSLLTLATPDENASRPVSMAAPPRASGDGA